MTAPVEDAGCLGPYKGSGSYRTEDRHLFFGRDQDAQQLVSLVMANPATLLHAPSAAGKTSLLNARLIPNLEAKGWIPIRIVPQENPSDSTRAAALAAVLPPPSLEALVIQRGLQVLEMGCDCSLDELLQEFDARAEADPDAVRGLIAPVPLPGNDVNEVTPYFTRLLRSGLPIEQFARHVALLASEDPRLRDEAPVTGSTRVRDLLDLLARLELHGSHLRLATDTTEPQRKLLPFFSHLVRLWKRELHGTSPQGMVLIFDQFEEMFTRFVDPGPSRARASAAPADPDQSKWLLRREFFLQLEELYAGAVPGSEAAPSQGDRHLPLRYVVSMRDEYVAQLDQIPHLPRDLHRARYHLRPLEKHQAKAAIAEPARHAGYDYSSQCLRAIVKGLVNEDKFVEPPHIQIVCGKLWQVCGKDLVGGEGYMRPPARRWVSVRTVRELGGVRSILRNSFPEYLGGLEEEDKTATLDILDALLTAEQTRNVVEKDRVLSAPFRNRERRGQLLDLLIRRRFVREEKRSGKVFIEISHEFLIEPMLEALASPETIDYREAIRTLERYAEVEFRFGLGQLLNPHEVHNLHAHREQIEWPAWATELMLRSVIFRSVGGQQWSEMVREWGNRYSTCDLLPASPSELLRLAENRRSMPTLLLEQLGDVETWAIQLDAEEVSVVLRSIILSARNRDQVTRWARKVLAHAK